MPSDLFQVIFGAIHDNWAIPALIRSVCKKRYLKDACCELIRWNDYGCSVLQCPSGFYVQKIMLVLAKMQISVLCVLSLSLNYRMKALMCALLIGWGLWTPKPQPTTSWWSCSRFATAAFLPLQHPLTPFVAGDEAHRWAHVALCGLVRVTDLLSWFSLWGSMHSGLLQCSQRFRSAELVHIQRRSRCSFELP